MSANTLKAIAVTAELTGTELSVTALKVMDSDLAAYPEASVLRALDRCRKELKGRLTLAAVLERVEEEDGRPGADEAWSIALASADEGETVVWTDEMAQAFGVAQPVLDARDKVGARMAFRDAYERMVRDARSAGVPCRWTVSIGHDAERRAVALQAAVTLKRLPAEAVTPYLLPSLADSPVAAALLMNKPQALLQSPGITESERDTNRRGLAALKAHLDQIDRETEERSARYEEAERSRKAEAERRKEGIVGSAFGMLKSGQEAADAN